VREVTRACPTGTVRSPAVLGSFLLALATLVPGCDLDYPEVVIVNRIAADVVIRDPGFNGCRWNVTLNFGDASVPKRCLPGDDRVHFQKLDLGKYADERAAAGTDIPQPMWFNYQTVSVKTVGEGDFRVFDVTADDLEQDFSIPGPYGH